MATLELEHITKIHADATVAVDDVDLRIEDGELFVIVGPSGSGKTSVLRAVAGLDALTGGRILIDGADVTATDTADRDLAMVFQSNVLYPHLTIADNIGFPLQLGRWPRSTIEARVGEVASTLQLDELLDRYPSQISGGQRQRAAIGRAIVRRSRLLLMDEPLSSLDAQLRTAMRAQIVSLQRRIGVTTLYVTHDQVEAMAMGDRAAIMRDGRIVQQGTPIDLYDHPVDMFVAQFIGVPTMAIVYADVVECDARIALRIGHQMLHLDHAAIDRWPTLRERVGSAVGLGIRSDALRVDPDGELLTSAVHVEHQGHQSVVRAVLDARPVVAGALAMWASESGPATVAVCVGPATRIDIFQPFRLAVDTAQVHLFDVATGMNLECAGRAPTAGADAAGPVVMLTASA